MSWMDSWSRPNANSKVPAPLYLSGDDVPYCHTCGRVMNSKKVNSKKQTANPIKYCSDRCRNRKPGALDRKIERTIASLLNGEEDCGLEKTAARDRVVKGDPRLIVTCGEIEEIIFGTRFDPEKTHGRRKNRKSRAIGASKEEWKSVDMVDSETSDSQDDEEDEYHDDHSDFGFSDDGAASGGGVRVRPPQTESDVNFSVGGERSRNEKIEETPLDLEKRREGAKRAEEREMVKRAARRAIVFGLEVPRMDPVPQKGGKKGKKGEERVELPPTEIRKAEGLMNGIVVEPSFAKGNWSVRWRDRTAQ
ncbi:unnamed protein product [Zymoseptoria tritici ST99CH_1A5]|uniref:Uncharacterized protein n=3 Tax=Zymoseptoria tritici TaxID=1047171 RepID=A0A1X7RS80_ZYMT9|nr:unnamed protein product [Zymoseptoria tritici ST99CH_3D7]SMR51269.1 unnamed protein product [Zymoseptoria tritici ST99CH_1E4]SMR52349.1 unnamed protein product [Zymoseptoria tritici ST99CH_3D1]SMY23962.1 unnamed protein product [Zymoseptoria tritici ST99CH_1A5]